MEEKPIVPTDYDGPVEEGKDSEVDKMLTTYDIPESTRKKP